MDSKHIQNIFLFLVVALAVFTIAAPTVFGIQFEVSPPPFFGYTPGESPASLVRYLFVAGLALGGLLALAMIVFAGIQYAASGANPGWQNDAKDRITQAILGLLLLLFSYLILGTINPSLVGLRDVRVPPPPPPLTHRSCVNFSCVVVQGAGHDQCQDNAECLVAREWACERTLIPNGTSTCNRTYRTEQECRDDVLGCAPTMPGTFPRNRCIRLSECAAPPPGACTVPPLTRMTDPIALQLELAAHTGGSTVVWPVDGRLRERFARFAAAWSASGTGRSAVATSAYRPMQYQRHLWEIMDRINRINALPPNQQAACQSLLQAVQNERSIHQLTGVVAPPTCLAPHTLGIAVDIIITGGTYAQADVIARPACLQWRAIPGDDVHFETTPVTAACPNIAQACVP